MDAWLAGWLDGWLAGWLADRPAGWLDGWMGVSKYACMHAWECMHACMHASMYAGTYVLSFMHTLVCFAEVHFHMYEICTDATYGCG